MATLVNKNLDKLFHIRSIVGFNTLDQGISLSKFNNTLTKGK